MPADDGILTAMAGNGKPGGKEPSGRVFIGIRYAADGSSARKVRVIKEAVSSLGFIPYVLEDDDFTGLSPKELMEKDFREIDACDAMILEVSEPSLGVGIEASYAREKMPVIAIARTGAAVSDTIKGIAHAFVEYTDAADLTETLRKHLR